MHLNAVQYMNNLTKLVKTLIIAKMVELKVLERYKKLVIQPPDIHSNLKCQF